ncbi:MAG TPA: exo-alpha-sialidase, partial [Verrucomicrobiae bacterium]
MACLIIGFATVSVAHGDPSGPVSWTGFIDPDQGSMVTGGGWGRMTLLTNGNWLCVSTAYPQGQNSYLQLYQSSDDAKSWSYVCNVKESGRVLDNGELITLTNGTLLLTMRSLILSNSYHLPVYESTNNGLAWVYLSNIDSNEGVNVGGLWEPKFYMLQNGVLAAFYSNESHPGYSQMISERISTNNGASWGPEIWAVAQAGGGSLRPGMPQICQMATGNYILVYEIVNIGNADVYYNISSNGMDWPSTLGTHIPCQHAG